MKKFLFSLYTFLLTLIFTLCSVAGWGQISMTTTSSYSQDFNTLKTSGTTNDWSNNSTLSNWYAVNFNNSYVADNGSGNAGGIKSYGTGTNTDRALGSLGSGSAMPYYGVQFRNNSTSAITDFKVAYTGEQWRKADNASKHKLYFSYKITSSSDTDLISGTWSSVSALDFEGPIANSATATSLDGNSSSNRNVIPATALSSISIPAGSYVMLRWNDINESGNDHGLAIDDVTVSWTVSPSSTVTITAQDPNSIATNWNAGSINNIFYYAALTPAGGNATLSSVKANMTGSYLAADIANNGFKLYYSADFDFTPAGDALLGAVSSAKSGATETLTWSSLSQAITASSTGYIYAVADVASSATDGRTVAGTFTGNSNIVFSPTVTYSASNTYGLTVNKTIVNTSPQLQYENGNNLNFGNVCINTTASTTGSFDLYGFNLTGNVTVGALSGYSYSTTLSGTYTSSLPLSPDGGGDLAETIYVKFTPTSVQSYNGNIAISGGGATTINVAVSGTGINGTPTITTNAATPVVNTIAQLNGNYSTPATCYSITQRGFIYSKTADNNNPTNTAVNGTTVLKVPVGTGTGSYNTNLTGLTPSTGYSYVAYVTDGTNYFYGAVQTFTTLGVATQIAFNPAPPATGNTNANLTTFKVEARRADNTVDTEYTGTVTLTKNSGPGNIQGTVSFNAVAGVATFSAVQFDAAGTYTISAASGSFTNIVSGNIFISTLSAASDFFRSRSAGPNNWSAAGSWESSPTGAAGTWNLATLYPGSSASGVEIQSGHTVEINSNITITNTVVNGKLVANSNYVVSGDDEVELTIKGGGEFIVNSAYKKSSGNAYGLVETDGKIIAGNGVDGSQFTKNYIEESYGLFYFSNGGICEWNATNTILGTAGSPTLFAPYNPGDIAILRFTAEPPTGYTFGNNDNDNLFNAVLEVENNVQIGIAGKMLKTFVGGIRGNGTVIFSAGYLTLGSSTVVPELGGNVFLKFHSTDNRVDLPNGATVTTGANFKIQCINEVQNRAIRRSGGTISINGILDVTNIRITNASAGGIHVNNGGVLRTSNTAGLFGSATAIPGNINNLLFNSGSTIEYYATANQSISSGKDYYHIIFSGAGTKTPGNNINVHKDGSVTITGTPIIDFSSSNLASTEANNTKFTMDGGRLILGTAELLPNMGGVYKITGGTIEFSNNADRIRTPNTFNNIEISVPAGKQVTYAGGNLTLNPNATVLVKSDATLTSTNGNASLVGTSNNALKLEPNATFRTAVIPGFYGPAASGLNPSPSVRNNITLDLDPGSIVEYARLSGSGGLPAGASSGDQQIVALPNGYPNLKIIGDDTKTAKGDVTVNGMTTVASAAATLLVPEYSVAGGYSNLSALGGINNGNEATGEVILGNDATLMQNASADNSNARIKMFRNIERRNGNEYDYLISPLIGQNLSSIYSATGSTLYYNEKTDFFANSTGAYIRGRGLAVKEPAVQTNASFFGQPFNETFSYALAKQGDGYNLVGNPYPSNLDLYQFYQDNSANINHDFLFWDKTVNTFNYQMGSGYYGYAYAKYSATTGTFGTGNAAVQGPIIGTKTPGRYVKVGQGFMLQAKFASNLQFSHGQRSKLHSSTVFFGKNNASDDRYWFGLKTPAGMQISNAVVYFPNGKNAFAIDDSKVNFSTSDALYTLVDAERVDIQGKAPFIVDDQLPVGYKGYSAGTYKFSLLRTEGIFAEGQAIYIHDKALNVFTNLQEGPYSFEGQGGVNENRFEIVYKPAIVLGTEGITKKNVIVYREGNDFVVESEGSPILEVDCYDSAGRLVKKVVDHREKVALHAQELPSGLYLLQIKHQQGTSVKRVLK